MTEQSSIENQSIPSFAIAIAKVQDALKGLSKRETDLVLKAVGALNNLRVIPIDRPVAPQGTNNFVSRVQKPPTLDKGKEKSLPPAVAEWKKHTSWLEFLNKHNTAVLRVKDATDENRDQELKALRELEKLGKELKSQLQGNVSVSSVVRGAAKELFATSPVVTGESG